jgi:hypothetical protein
MYLDVKRDAWKSTRVAATGEKFRASMFVALDEGPGGVLRAARSAAVFSDCPGEKQAKIRKYAEPAIQQIKTF